MACDTNAKFCRHSHNCTILAAFRVAEYFVEPKSSGNGGQLCAQSRPLLRSTSSSGSLRVSGMSQTVPILPSRFFRQADEWEITMLGLLLQVFQPFPNIEALFFLAPKAELNTRGPGMGNNGTLCAPCWCHERSLLKFERVWVADACRLLLLSSRWL